ncbi:hypothetical protein KC887_04320 [Candidatus Kaiserbacteria bacterium]|nr:hypothetical protein [Candidatus Kaiserbacteria bacterium]
MLNHVDYVNSLKDDYSPIAVDNAFALIAQNKDDYNGDWPYPSHVIAALCQAAEALEGNSDNVAMVKILATYIQERL